MDGSQDQWYSHPDRGWNKQNGQLSLVYDNKLTSPEKVQKALAEVGHDCGTFKADQKVYDKLPGCCKYRDNAGKH